MISGWKDRISAVLSPFNAPADTRLPQNVAAESDRKS